jgi:hypothetical protein
VFTGVAGTGNKADTNEQSTLLRQDIQSETEFLLTADKASAFL